MKIFTIHVSSKTGFLESDIRLIKEGFSWPAFLCTVFWLIWNRLWLGFFVSMLFIVFITLASDFVGFNVWINLVFLSFSSFILGIIGNDLFRLKLNSSGFIESGVIASENQEKATQRLLDTRQDLFAGGAS
jgi:hypothetical protein